MKFPLDPLDQAEVNGVVVTSCSAQRTDRMSADERETLTLQSSDFVLSLGAALEIDGRVAEAEGFRALRAVVVVSVASVRTQSKFVLSQA